MSTASIVIPTLNEEANIGSLLSDVAFQSRPPDEVFVADAGSEDGTVEAAKRYPFVTLLEAEKPVARGRNAGGRAAGGDVLVFLDADARLGGTFLENFLAEFERRGLDVACPHYVPYRSTLALERFHDLFNLVIRTFQGTMPSGAGTCIAIKRNLFQASSGFDPSLKFDDIELIRRLSKGGRFGIVEERVYVSDRRYKEGGFARTVAQYSLMALIFALGKYHWANALDYEIGVHKR